MVDSALASFLASKLDARTKFKLLDMLDERPVSTVDALDPVANAWSPEAMERLLRDELEYLVIDSLFAGEEAMLLACRAEAEDASLSFMKEAGFGKEH